MQENLQKSISPFVLEFWKRNNTPIGLMVQKARKHGLLEHQIKRAACIVYEESREIIENVPEIKPWMGIFAKKNGKKIWVPSKGYEKAVLFHNTLHHDKLGWRVFIVARHVMATEYQLEPPVTFRRWLKSLNWRIEYWQ